MHALPVSDHITAMEKKQSVPSVLPAPADQPPAPHSPAHLADRTASGQFRAGYSGNPAGRPRSESAALRQKLAERGEDVLRVVLDAALEGDMAAARMVLERLLPPLRPHSETVPIPIEAATGPAGTARAILSAAVAGSISPDAAVQLLSAAASLSRIIETEELKVRLEALERAVKPHKLS
jgi:hypothetical protein